MTIDIIQVDYHNPRQAGELIALLDEYARDPMGGGSPLSDYARHHLIAGLQTCAGAISLICYLDGKAVALTNCFAGFSTFAARPLLNIHDIMVSQAYRGRGLSRLLLEAVEAIARQRNCCKITLEVLSGNAVAQSAYRAFGFQQYQLDPASGQAQFWQKTLL
jgi:ribosomal protein S18 acetylase RimI-like enzyme